MRRTIWCNHYLAPAEHTTCKAGIEYEKFKQAGGRPFENWPCFMRDGKPPSCACEHARFPTAEELAAEDKEIEERCANMGKARKAIVDHLGGPWKKGTAGASGNIPCPVCEGGTLHFSRAGYNGHIHARCSTKGCMNWME